MPLRSIFCLFLAVPLFSAAQPLPVATARALAPGTPVTVRGIVTNGPELGVIRFVQDGTGGIAVYPGNGSVNGLDAVSRGDSVEISGFLSVFQGLTEISPVTSIQVIASGQPLPEPVDVTLDQLSESLEGRLVRIDCVRFYPAGAAFSSSGAYELNDAQGNSGRIYLRNDSPLLGENPPVTPIRLTAILSQYNDYQLLPRDGADLGPAGCLFFSEKIRASQLFADGFDLSFETSAPAEVVVRYGDTPEPDQEIVLPGNNTVHTVQVTGLQPGTIYWVEAGASAGGTTMWSELVPVATRSLSSGQIKVLFNHPIEESLAGNLQPAGQSFAECRDEIIARIDAAQQTVDVAMYNNNRSDLTEALKAAQARGVRVRYIAAAATGNAALSPAPPFPVVYGNEEGLMHDKFLVIDADLSDAAWIMSGSLNWTTGNMVYDFNNLLFIQDQSLAKAYELEFEEMWGSTGAQPNLANSRFGSAKTDNTPHQFVIDNIQVECWFSPSDGVTQRIVETLQDCDETVDFALFTFTRNEPGNALLDAFDDDRLVRGMIENIDDPGCEYDYLLDNGVNVTDHPASAYLHHKYVVVDAFSTTSDPTVLTGSHNWSTAAETVNDENTLVFHDADIARLFAAEFQRRWAETTTATNTPGSDGWHIFPNPASEYLNINGLTDFTRPADLTVFDAVGRRVFQTRLTASSHSAAIGALPPGTYVAKISTPDGAAALPFQKI